ncbi:MAG: ABC transporter ATP-binding protein [Magnetococcales bacterium]|nr:ABC transporter ATP-binding protein [Magnetococcales bacterium]
MTPLLAVQGLSLTAGTRRLCENLHWSIRPGECWALLGPNGAGKSTLLHALAGLRSVDAGEILLQGQPIPQWSRRALARQVGILFQEHAYPFPATVLEIVLAGRHPHVPFWSQDSAEDLALAHAALRATGLEELAARRVETLSGGERRRMEVATLLLQSPRLILLDEPTNHLDLNHQIGLIALWVEQVKTRAGALIMVVHDVNLAARFCDHFLFLFGTGESRHGPREEMLQGPLLTRLFDHPMLAVESGERTWWVPG